MAHFHVHGPLCSYMSTLLSKEQQESNSKIIIFNGITFTTCKDKNTRKMCRTLIKTHAKTREVLDIKTKYLVSPSVTCALLKHKKKRYTALEI